MSNTIRIRSAFPEDLNEIARIESECFPEAEAAAKQDFQKRIEAYPNGFWLLFEGDTLIGFVNGMVTDEKDLRDEMYENAALHNPAGAWQMIFGVDVIPSHRKRGYAELLLRQAIADARSQNRAGLVLTCKQALIPYYAKLGFVNEGLSQSVHGKAVWYQMRLRFRD